MTAMQFLVLYILSILFCAVVFLMDIRDEEDDL